ncbi:hypothetical protein bpmyx0001_21280 [Bacillus pseudomycoides DSM 12442]|nr:hypothetical protein bpmyx0001_21280 [Bacillus pseudomycoides DSM 12442]
MKILQMITSGIPCCIFKFMDMNFKWGYKSIKNNKFSVK